ncbi:polyphosphate kinase [Kineosphaera limosa]|nr:RNA degradosome polyphosphate kinase [Kineosphaera limosa]NYD99754.1 polyphosphate kinase [Kineosphaera limosa]
MTTSARTQDSSESAGTEYSDDPSGLGAPADTPDTADLNPDRPQSGATPIAAVSQSSSLQRPRAANGRFVSLEVGPTAGESAATSNDELPADRFLDREVSWLQFNERVLQLAADPDQPLLERARFLAIFASNLDEFFMVRVAGLKRRVATGLAVRSASGLEPREVLESIHTVSDALMREHAEVFREVVRPALAANDIHLLSFDELADTERDKLSEWFTDLVFPVLTPLAVDPAHPFPYISGLSLNLAVVLANAKTGTEHFARVKVPSLLPRFVRVPAVDTDEELYSARFVPLEEVIAAHLDMLFPGMEVRDHITFRVTRNEDLEVEEDDAENLLTALEKELTRRRFGPPVRLEVDEDTDDHVLDLLKRELQISTKEVVRLPTPLDLRGLNAIADLDRTELKYPAFVPRTHPDLARVESAKAANIMAAVRTQDVLVQHPYDSFSTSVQAFIEQAAADPKVLAIKQTLYRTSGDSPIIDALIDAAEAGKQVLAVVEIKARFDEQNNIEWARKLEHSGVHVVYGVVGLKTHCKLSLVVRQESEGLRRYCHVGTGNYHPKTARLYEDFGLFTCDPKVGEDLTKLFNQLSGWAPRSKYKRLLVAPRSLRSGLLERIDEQIQRVREGQEGYVGIKVNSMVDEALIDALYRASQAGVRIDVLVRGICALRPRVPGLSENIEVRSILGRFLEHSRVFVFGLQGEGGVYIGSADMMHRNLDRRVETLVRISDPRHVEDLVRVVRRGMSDTTSSWHLTGEGRWHRHNRGNDGEPLTDLQTALITEHGRRRRRPRSR